MLTITVDDTGPGRVSLPRAAHGPRRARRDPPAQRRRRPAQGAAVADRRRPQRRGGAARAPSAAATGCARPAASSLTEPGEDEPHAAGPAGGPLLRRGDPRHARGRRELHGHRPAAGPRPPRRRPACRGAATSRFASPACAAGRNSVDFDNTGAPAAPRVLRADARAAPTSPTCGRFFGQQTSVGPPPVDPSACARRPCSRAATGRSRELDLAAGRYALICFVRGADGGPRHLELGMINEVTVR